MLVRARSCLPLILLVPLVMASPLACDRAAAVPEDCDAGRDEREALEKDIASLKAEKQRLIADLETERGCREQVVTSLSKFAEGPYDEVVAEFAEEAKALLEARVAKRKKGEKLAIVLDIDETVVSNLEQLRKSSYCFVRENWNAWVDTGVPTPLAGIRPLYDYARANQVAVVFLTGRKQAQREDTERVLKAAGIEAWDHLLLRDPAEDELSAAEYKSGRRAKLEAEGYTVVLSIGDQQSDLDGGHAEHTVLIPNPFYHVK